MKSSRRSLHGFQECIVPVQCSYLHLRPLRGSVSSRSPPARALPQRRGSRARAPRGMAPRGRPRPRRPSPVADVQQQTRQGKPRTTTTQRQSQSSPKNPRQRYDLPRLCNHDHFCNTAYVFAQPFRNFNTVEMAWVAGLGKTKPRSHGAPIGSPRPAATSGIDGSGGRHPRGKSRKTTSASPASSASPSAL